MHEQTLPAAAARPFFVPEGIDFASLPPAIQIAFREIVAPAYAELVLGAATALEKSAGATFVFLLAEELLEQCAMGRNMDLAQTQDPAQVEQRAPRFNRHLKLVNSKQLSANYLLKLKSLRAKQGPLGLPPEIA